MTSERAALNATEELPEDAPDQSAMDKYLLYHDGWVDRGTAIRQLLDDADRPCLNCNGTGFYVLDGARRPCLWEHSAAARGEPPEALTADEIARARQIAATAPDTEVGRLIVRLVAALATPTTPEPDQ